MPGEAVVSRDLVDALPEFERYRLALLGRRAIKGKQEPIEVYSMLLDEGAATQMLSEGGGQAEETSPVTVMPSVVVDLDYRGKTVSVYEGGRCLIGRAERCGLVVMDPRMSREHAWVEVRAGRASLADQSSTGSWIIDGDGVHTTLRRESGPFGGFVVIRLALHPRDAQSGPGIDFRLRVVV